MAVAQDSHLKVGSCSCGVGFPCAATAREPRQICDGAYSLHESGDKTQLDGHTVNHLVDDTHHHFTGVGSALRCPKCL